MPNYALNEHYERFIRKQLESGRYNNASKVVRAGLAGSPSSRTAGESQVGNGVPDCLPSESGSRTRATL
nr:type II toxin-antitoxin system ParD family antitoxin [Mesorhizobium sp. CA16]MBZ9914385.1 type II toxin-antitoxin system ParD family antitoxin [Mesorhizobium sp. CA16]